MKQLDKQESTELTQSDTFKPTPHMLVWLDVAMQIKSDSPLEISEACKEMGSSITRAAWYEWKKLPGFLNWYYAQWKEQRKAWLGELDAIGMKMAKRGDYNFWKDMNKKIGELEEPQKGGVYIQQNFADHAKNELKEFE